MSPQPAAPTPAAWVEQAACRGADPTLFLAPTTRAQVHDALATCGSCPVRQQCLQLGLAQPPGADPGIWGGTTPDDRQRLRNGRDNTTANAPTRPGPDLPPAEHGPPAPQTRLVKDRHGIHRDDTGRIEVCELQRAPKRMVLLDGRPVARTRTLADARRASWQALRDHPTPPTARTAARSHA